NAGFLTDPGYLDFVNNPGSEFEPVYGGWNPALVWPGLLELFGVSDEVSEIGQVFDPSTIDLSALSGGFDPSSFDMSALFAGFDPGSLDLGLLFGGFDPAEMSAEFANLLEDLTAAWIPDLA